MEGIKSPSSVTIGALTRNIKEFEEKIQNGTEDPDRFLTLSEIEELWGKLIGDALPWGEDHRDLGGGRLPAAV